MNEDDLLSSDYNDPSEVVTQDDSGNGDDQTDSFSGLTSALSTIQGAAQVVQAFQNGANVLIPVVVTPKAAAANSAAGPQGPGFFARLAARFKVSMTVVYCAAGALTLIVGYGVYRVFKKEA